MSPLQIGDRTFSGRGHSTERLGNLTGSVGCIFPHSDKSTELSLSTFRSLENRGVPLSGTPVRPVNCSSCVYTHCKCSGSLTERERTLCAHLSRRLVSETCSSSSSHASDSVADFSHRILRMDDKSEEVGTPTNAVLRVPRSQIQHFEGLCCSCRPSDSENHVKCFSDSGSRVDQSQATVSVSGSDKLSGRLHTSRTLTHETYPTLASASLESTSGRPRCDISCRCRSTECHATVEGPGVDQFRDSVGFLPSPVSSVHRQFENRVGSSSERHGSERRLVRGGPEYSHKSTRDESHPSSSDTFPVVHQKPDNPCTLRQCYGGLVSYPSGRNSFPLPVSDHLGDLHVVLVSQGRSTSPPYSIKAKCPSRCIVEGETTSFGVVSSQAGFSDASSNVSSLVSGSICNASESPASTLCVTVPRRAGDRGRCTISPVGVPGDSVCVSSDVSHTSSSTSSSAGADHLAPISTFLAQTVLVCGSSGSLRWAPSLSTIVATPSVTTTVCSSTSGPVPSTRLGVVRDAHRDRGFSEATLPYLTNSPRIF
jgi:hypothetical protein